MRTRISLLLLAVTLTACGLDDEPLPTGPEGGAEAGLVTGDRCGLVEDDAYATSLLDALSADVAAALSRGDLDSGRAAALQRHIDNAKRALGNGRYCAAVDQIVAFREQVEDWQLEGVLSDRQASPLLRGVRLLFEPPAPSVDDLYSYAPGVVGEIRTGIYQGESITYEVIDGLAIYQGDMILGYADEIEALPGPISSGPQQVGVCSSPTCPWPGGIVPYDFADDWGDKTAQMRINILTTLAHWQDRTSLRFVRRTTGPRVVFRNATGCSSFVGGATDPHYVNVRADCPISHELGHAIGFWHEQSRNDRDAFVRIYRDRIEVGKEGNFDKYGTLGTDIGAYDFGSIMHYFCTSFQKDGETQNTLEPIDPSISCSTLGVNWQLSEGDVLGAYTLYPPAFTVAQPFPLVDFQFDLVADFTTEPVDDAYLVWRSDKTGGEVGRGRTLEIRPGGTVPIGQQNITFSIEIFGVVVASRTVFIELFDPFEITSPSSGSVYQRGVENVRLEALIHSSVRGATLEWTTDNPPGFVLGTGTSVVRSDLWYGWHNIVATLTDAGGKVATRAVRIAVHNTSPELHIQLPVLPPSGELCVGEAITFFATGEDINQPHLPGSAYEWDFLESADPATLGWSPIGHHVGQSVTLPFGTVSNYRVEAVVEDEAGERGGDLILFTVADCGGNQPPTVQITEPAADILPGDPAGALDGFDAALGLYWKDITLTGVANDAEDGPLGGQSLTWTVTSGLAQPDQDQGDSVQFRLYSPSCTGTWHVIQLAAEDSRGEQRAVIRRIFIGGLC